MAKPTINIRSPKLTDKPLMMRGHEDTCRIEQAHFDPDKYSKRIDLVIAEGRAVVLEVDGKAVGFMEYKMSAPDLPNMDDCAWACLDFILEDYRGRGYSKIIWNEVFKRLKERGAKRLAFDIFAVNKISQKIRNFSISSGNYPGAAALARMRSGSCGTA